MVSRVSSSSASAAVVVVAAAEDLVKGAEDALKMKGASAMSVNGPFEAFCSRLETCNINDILMVLAIVLKGHESETVKERVNAHHLLDALSKNGEMQKALTHLLENTDCGAYFNSAKMLRGLYSALKNAEMYRECIQILIDASKKQDVSLRDAAHDRMRDLTHVVAAEGAMLADEMFLAALTCQDNEDSKDLSVRYFESLFADRYFQRKEIGDHQLVVVIERAQTMLVSGDLERMIYAEDFFKKFINMATPQQFACLPEEMIEIWKKLSENEEYGDCFAQLLEQHQKRTAEAVSSS